MITAFRGAYRFLSNFYPSPVTWGGRRYETVEHAYQAAKASNPEDRRMIQEAASPGAAKRAARKMKIRPDWNEIRLRVMEHLLRRKFASEPLKQWLLGTGDEQLIEGNTWGDRFWGVCGGVGENHLGKLLMEIRQELRG